MPELPAPDNANDSSKAEQDPTPTPPADGKTPGWEGDFDPERAARLVANLREENKKAKDEAVEYRKKLADIADAEKTEVQRLQDRAERAESELNATKSALLTAEIAKEYGVPVELLAGANREEIEAKAKALAEWAAVAKRPADDLPKKPKARLMQGHEAGDAEGEPFDAKATAAKIRERY